MKYVRLDNGRVAEILPPETYGNIAYWYGEEFATKCVQAPDDVEEYMVYENGEFLPAPPDPPAQPDPIEQLREEYDPLFVELAFRTTLLELGVN